MIVATVLYKTGVEFDQDYYRTKHIQLVKDKLTPLGMRSYEVRKIVGTADGAAPPYQVMFSMYFDTMDALQNAMQHPDMGTVGGDIPNFYKGNPEILVGDIA